MTPVGTGAAANLIERALHQAGAGAELPADRTSERILDAALELVAASGMRALTMDAVAARASTGRMTVYRRFGDRERLVDALASREARRCLAALDAAVDPDAPAGEQVAQGFVESLRLVREHPLLERLSRHEPAGALAALNQDRGTLLALSRAFVAERLRSAQRDGLVAEGLDAEQAAEVLVRLGFSFLLMPGTALPVDDPPRAAAVARELIAPIVEPRPAAEHG